MKRLTLATLFLLTGCVKTGFPSLMCQYRGNWSAVDDFALVADKDASGYRPTSDKQGNTYVVGYGVDSTDAEHWIVRKSADRGATWTTVDDYQLATGFGAIGLGILAQPSGNLFTVGYAFDSVPNLVWVVRKSADQGATWTTSETFQLSANQTASADSVLQDSAGTLYVSGSAASGTGVLHWIVRKSLDSGTTWTTVDDFNLAGGQDSGAQNGTFDASGALYIAGSGTDSSINTRWIVRKTSDSGTNWTTVDDFAKVTGQAATASAVGADISGSLVAVGYSNTALSVNLWTTRRSTDGGANWTTVDEFALADGQESQANSVVRDPFGNFYVVGSAMDASVHRHLVLRKSSDGGITWSTIHDYQVASDSNTSGYRLSSDPDGNLYVVGRGQSSPTASYKWFTHLLKCE